MISFSEIKRNEVHQENSFYFLTLNYQSLFLMVSNFSVIPISWVLTVNSEMLFFLFHSLTEGVLVTELDSGLHLLVLFIYLFIYFFIYLFIFIYIYFFFPCR